MAWRQDAREKILQICVLGISLFIAWRKSQRATYYRFVYWDYHTHPQPSNVWRYIYTQQKVGIFITSLCYWDYHTSSASFERVTIYIYSRKGYIYYRFVCWDHHTSSAFSRLVTKIYTASRDNIILLSSWTGNPSYINVEKYSQKKRKKAWQVSQNTQEVNNERLISTRQNKAHVSPPLPLCACLRYCKCVFWQFHTSCFMCGNKQDKNYSETT